jgi:hypothetical protein
VTSSNTTKTVQTRGQVSLVSPRFHPHRVKRESGGKAQYIKEKNNSLSMFHSFTPTPSRDARPCVYPCVREGVGERVKPGNGRPRYAGPLSRPDQARPNGIRCRLTIQAQPNDVQRSRVHQAEPNRLKRIGTWLPDRQPMPTGTAAGIDSLSFACPSASVRATLATERDTGPRGPHLAVSCSVGALWGDGRHTGPTWREFERVQQGGWK